MKLNVKKRFIPFILLYLFTGVNGFAQKKHKLHRKGQWTANFRLYTGYNDNALKYSEKYLERFMNNLDPKRFEIITYDDVSIKGRLFVSYRKKWFSRHYSRISFAFQRTQYTMNTFKSWNMFSIYLRQDFARKASVQFTYQYLPYFYVRTYRDEDLVSIYGYSPNTFRPFEFNKEHYGLSLRNTFYKKWRVQLNTGLHRYFHNSHFTEYDSEKYYTGLKLEYPVTSNLKFAFGYQFAFNNAKGIDQSGEVKDESDDPDAGFYENKIDIKAAFSPKHYHRKKQTLELLGSYIARDFTSPKKYRDDPTHVGRKDNIYSITLQYSIKWTSAIKTAIIVNHNFRRSINSGSDYYRYFLMDEKNYSQNLYGIQLNYKIF